MTFALLYVSAIYIYIYIYINRLNVIFKIRKESIIYGEELASYQRVVVTFLSK